MCQRASTSAYQVAQLPWQYGHCWLNQEEWQGKTVFKDGVFFFLLYGQRALTALSDELKHPFIDRDLHVPNVDDQ